MDAALKSLFTLPDSAAYLIDAWQRSLLTLDTLRERGNLFLAHAQAGKPALLKFPHEQLMDGRDLPHPCNYALLHILPPDGQPGDPTRRPIVIVDPRAGHGPGIGGFKPDSEIGVALAAGHAVYFITFAPEPVDGQTLVDVARAEAAFIEEVARRHPKAPGRPAVIGNCQAGWAVAALAAVRSELMGPIVLNGAPLSYWAGSDEQNPMRYSGGMLGGAWLSALTSDLCGDRFDGAHLVDNFERLKPGHSYWGKYYHLYDEVDTERERFLDFERWWGGYFRMTGEEIEAIVENLFIGNRLARGEVVMDGLQVDLRQIRAPLLIFASWGDNITPPQQALDWIIDVWGDEKALVAAGRTIVYMLHPHIGHLGIFVGGAVARKEHGQIVDVLELVEALPPGLYEMSISAHAPGQPADVLDALEPGPYHVDFQTRRMDDLRALNPQGRQDEALFSTVAQVSELNMQAYRRWLQPGVQRLGHPLLGDWLRWLHPLRQQHLALSDLNPLVSWLGEGARLAREHRRPADAGNPWRAWEQLGAQLLAEHLDHLAGWRDTATAAWVGAAYGPLGLGAILPPRPADEAAALARAKEGEAAARQQALAAVDQGGMAEAVCRILLAGLSRLGVLDRRGLRLGQRLADSHRRLAIRHAGPAAALHCEDWPELLARQAVVMAFAPREALDALPRLLPSLAEREQALALAAVVLRAEPGLADSDAPAARFVRDTLGVDPTRVTRLAAALDRHGVTASLGSPPVPDFASPQ